jgi:hypothetical protein
VLRVVRAAMGGGGDATVNVSRISYQPGVRA